MACYTTADEIDNRLDRHFRRIKALERKYEQMALDMTGLTKGIADIGQGVADIAAEMKNNPDQATIDAMASSLEGFAGQLETLSGKTTAPAVVDTTTDTTSSTDTAPAPASGT